MFQMITPMSRDMLRHWRQCEVGQISVQVILGAIPWCPQSQHMVKNAAYVLQKLLNFRRLGNDRWPMERYS